jgi:hypothetical protein
VCHIKLAHQASDRWHALSLSQLWLTRARPLVTPCYISFMPSQIDTLSQRRARLSDLSQIVTLYLEDELGQERESLTPVTLTKYTDAFARLDTDSNQYLMVVGLDNVIVGTCHLTIMPSLTFSGSTRMQIEAVRVTASARGKKIGDSSGSGINYAHFFNRRAHN